MTISTSQDNIFDYKPTLEDQRQKFNAILAELMLTPADLATFINKKDYRDYSATVRGIQRMVSGETRVSGEMMVIANMLLRQHRRLKARYPNLQWKQDQYGVYRTQVEDWYVCISPQTRGRWILSCRHGTGAKDFSPAFGRWLDSLEEAKNKALACVEEGMNDLAELSYEIT